MFEKVICSSTDHFMSNDNNFLTNDIFQLFNADPVALKSVAHNKKFLHFVQDNVYYASSADRMLFALQLPTRFL